MAAGTLEAPTVTTLDPYIDESLNRMREGFEKLVFDFKLAKTVTTPLALPIIIERPVDTEAELAAWRAGALEWVNDCRVQMGQEPIDELPQGIQGSVSECVLARAFDGCFEHVSGEEAEKAFGPARRYSSGEGPGCGTGFHNGEPRAFTMTQDAANFAMAFDRGKYPSLVAQPRVRLKLWG